MESLLVAYLLSFNYACQTLQDTHLNAWTTIQLQEYIIVEMIGMLAACS